MIVAISGKINSGKDTIGKIIQILIDSPHFTNEAVISFLNKPAKYSYINMKFADSLKDMICIMLNCTREQLEDREFKEKELGEEWWYYKVSTGYGKYRLVNYLDNNESDDWIQLANRRYLIKPTPRLLLQLLGTECGRNMLHPNVWVNSLMSKYKSSLCNDGIFCTSTNEQGNRLSWIPNPITEPNSYPNWVITDLRFPNELKIIKDRQGISIRVNRPYEIMFWYNGDQYNTKDLFEEVHKDTGEYPSMEYVKEHWIVKEHESETALDNTTFDVTIDNNGTLSDLVDKCRDVIKKFELK